MWKAGILILCVVYFTNGAPRCPVCFNGKTAPGCPVCIQFFNQCNENEDCTEGKLCCLNTNCGRECVDPDNSNKR